MDVETGDRVSFKKKLPDRKEKELQHHVGWERDPDSADEWDGQPGTPGSRPIMRTWSQQFGGVSGVVVAVDPTNRLAMVRGRDVDGQPFTIEMPEAYMTVTAHAADGE